MTKISTWKKVGIDVESALGSVITITAISKASEAVVTGTHSLAVGDYVRMIGITGMKQMDEIVARVKSVSTTVSFVLEEIDSTLWDTFVSGTARRITFGNSMATIQEINPGGGDPEFTSTTTVHAEMDTEIPTGGYSTVTYDMTSIFDPSDTVLKALRAAMRSKTSLAIKFNFDSGAKIVFSAYVAAPFTPGGSSGGVIQTPVKLRARAIPTPYAT